MANADGGVILLGVQEKPRGSFRALGLADVERVRKALWDNLHNRKQVSVNLLTEQDVDIGADRRPRGAARPRATGIAPNNGPCMWGATRLGAPICAATGDYQADDEAVRRMVAERVEDSRDERVLKGYDFGDLDMDTVAAYRNRFAAVSRAMCGATCRFWSALGRLAKTARQASAVCGWRVC